MSAARRRRHAALRLLGVARMSSCCWGGPGAQYPDGFLGRLAATFLSCPGATLSPPGRAITFTLASSHRFTRPSFLVAVAVSIRPAVVPGLQLDQHQFEDEACHEASDSISLGQGLLAHENCLQLLRCRPLESSLIWMTALSEDCLEDPERTACAG